MHSITTNLYSFGYNHFSLLSRIGFSFCGVKEIVWDGLLTQHRSKDIESQKLKKAFSIGHGTFYFASGISGTLVVLKVFKVAIPILRALEMGCFITACVGALAYFVKTYEMAHEDAANEKAIKHSCAIAIISNISYLLWCTYSLLGLSSSLAFIFCCIGLVTGCYKTLHDFFMIS